MLKFKLRPVLDEFSNSSLYPRGQVLDGRKFRPSGTGLFMVNKDQDQSFIRDFDKYFH